MLIDLCSQELGALLTSGAAQQMHARAHKVPLGLVSPISSWPLVISQLVFTVDGEAGFRGLSSLGIQRAELRLLGDRQLRLNQILC